MAENPEFPDVVEQKTREAIGRLIDEQDWEEEERTRLHKEYMNEFSNVLREMMPMIESLYAGTKPTVTESTDADEEALENAKVRHEATVISVTKRRKEYPQYLTKLLGKTMRLKKNTAAVVKIDLPSSEPMETVNLEDTYFDTLIRESNDSPQRLSHNILMDTERLAGLAEFGRVSLKENPVTALMQQTEDTDL